MKTPPPLPLVLQLEETENVEAFLLPFCFSSFFLSSPQHPKIRKTGSTSQNIYKRKDQSSSGRTDLNLSPADVITEVAIEAPDQKCLNMIIPLSNSSRSSNPSSPRTSETNLATPSFNYTPASSLFDACDREDYKTQIAIPSYDDASYYSSVEHLESPAGPHSTGDHCKISPAPHSTSINAPRLGSLEPFKRGEDDAAVCAQPSRHIDYLSHNWREEDIWSTWKYIVAKRGAYNDSTRLENASWRAWMKLKSKLKTISPETLGWQVLILRFPVYNSQISVKHY